MLSCAYLEVQASSAVPWKYRLVQLCCAVEVQACSAMLCYAVEVQDCSAVMLRYTLAQLYCAV